MDKGPWKLFYGLAPRRELIGLQSDDFEHDVTLKVSGDFYDLEQKERYCNWLAARLNAREQ
jgi:hypothetical protein